MNLEAFIIGSDPVKEAQRKFEEQRSRSAKWLKEHREACDQEGSLSFEELSLTIEMASVSVDGVLESDVIAATVDDNLDQIELTKALVDMSDNEFETTVSDSLKAGEFPVILETLPEASRLKLAEAVAAQILEVQAHIEDSLEAIIERIVNA